MKLSDLAGEAVRLHNRYLIEIVEELGFCPWARRARVTGRTRQHVSMAATVPDAIVAATEAIEACGRESSVEVAFVIYPQLTLERRAFDAFAARVIENEGARHPIGEVPFMLAAFHPDAPADMKTPERLVPFLRRTPDPCLQLVRASVLEAVRENTPQGTQLIDLEHFDPSTLSDEPPLRERIARSNHETVVALGVAELTRRFEEIRADRERTYSALEV
ncbi:MAG TPA: DUF1415 family protein [Polyangiaceae bacterium]|jgi:hypothetical protein